jgi:hypothetical protein
LRQLHVWSRLHERFEGRHHRLEIGNLPLQSADSSCGVRGRGLGRGSCAWRLSLLRFGWGLTLLGKNGACGGENQKHSSRHYNP